MILDGDARVFEVTSCNLGETARAVASDRDARQPK